MSEPNYFLDKDFEPYLDKQIDYLSYVGPRGTGDNDHDRYLGELEEYKLIKIQPHLLTMENKGSFPVGNTGKRRNYTDVMLVPISQIVEIRISMHLDPAPEPDPEPQAALAD